MPTITSKDQFQQEAQTMLQDIEQRLNDLTQANYGNNKSISEETADEVNKLKNQHRNLKEALERYGTVSGDRWQQIQTEVQSIFDEADSAWQKYRTNPSAVASWSTPPRHSGSEQDSKYQRSTGQSDHGDSGEMTGMGDRGGMEDNRGRGRAYDDSDTVNNRGEGNNQYQLKDQLATQRNIDHDENIDEEGGVVGQEDDRVHQHTHVSWDYNDHAGFTGRSARSGGIHQGDQGPAVGNDYSDDREGGVKTDRSSNWQPTDTGKDDYETNNTESKENDEEENAKNTPQPERPWDSRSL